MGTIDNLLNSLNLGRNSNAEDEYLDDYDDAEEYDDQPKKSSKAKNEEKKFSKVTNIGKKKVVNNSQYEINVIKPKDFNSSKEITESLLEGTAVLLNLSQMPDIDLARRVLDFAMGTTYALAGTIEKITDTIFVIVPEGVDISGALGGEDTEE